MASHSGDKAPRARKAPALSDGMVMLPISSSRARSASASQLESDARAEPRSLNTVPSAASPAPAGSDAIEKPKKRLKVTVSPTVPLSQTAGAAPEDGEVAAAPVAHSRFSEEDLAALRDIIAEPGNRPYRGQGETKQVWARITEAFNSERGKSKSVKAVHDRWKKITNSSGADKEPTGNPQELTAVRALYASIRKLQTEIDADYEHRLEVLKPKQSVGGYSTIPHSTTPSSGGKKSGVNSLAHTHDYIIRKRAAAAEARTAAGGGGQAGRMKEVDRLLEALGARPSSQSAPSHSAAVAEAKNKHIKCLMSEYKALKTMGAMDSSAEAAFQARFKRELAAFDAEFRAPAKGEGGDSSSDEEEHDSEGEDSNETDEGDEGSAGSGSEDSQ